MLDAVASVLAIGIGDETKRGLIGEWRWSAEKVGRTDDGSADHPVVITGIGSETRQFHMVNEGSATAGDAGTARLLAKGTGETILHQTLATHRSLPADHHRGGGRGLQVRLHQQVPDLRLCRRRQRQQQ